MKADRLIYILTFLSAFAAHGQFQKKFTIDVGASALFPIKNELRDDRRPYLFSNFEQGYGLYTNVLYNTSRKLSFGMMVNLNSFTSWQDPRVDGGRTDKSFFNVYSFQPNVKYKLWDRKISPFVTGGVGISIYHAKRAQTNILIEDFYPIDYETEYLDGGADWLSIDEVLIREPGYEVKPNTVFSTLAGAGFDIRISESLGITVMACYNLAFAQGNFTIDQNIRYWSVPVGVNLNLGKTKAL